MIISPEFKIELKKVYKRYYYRWWCKNNKDKLKEHQKEYRSKPEYKEKSRINCKKYRSKPENKEKQKEYRKEYNKTPNGKKIKTLSDWKSSGLIETKEEIDKIYEIYLIQIYCEACNIKLTRTGKNCKTDTCMDHCHITNRFRQIICRSCNIHDKWKKYISFC
tara:strand:- start:845 stop:1333 length:489 start_codon:yes stop_codon:yes gene_type:complete